MWFIVLAAIALVAIGAGSSHPAGKNVSAFFKGKYLAESETPGTFFIVDNPPFAGAKSASYLVAMAITQWHTGVWVSHDGHMFRFGDPEHDAAKNEHDGFVLVAQPAKALAIHRG